MSRTTIVIAVIILVAVVAALVIAYVTGNLGNTAVP